jgi:hypothetical protein
MGMNGRQGEDVAVECAIQAAAPPLQKRESDELAPSWQRLVNHAYIHGRNTFD